MLALLRDFGYAARLLKNKPAFAAVVILTLALGIGANTAIFTVVDQVLLSPLSLPAPQALLKIQETHLNSAHLTGATFADLQDRTRTLAHVMEYRIFTRNLADRGQGSLPEQIDTAFVSPDFFAVAAQHPRLGQEFAPEQYARDAMPALILSDSLWRQMFDGDPSVVGRTVTLHGKPATITGVMSPGFAFPENAQAWAPLTEDMALRHNRRAHLFVTVARLQPGAGLKEAQAELKAIGASINADSGNVDPGISLSGTSLQESIVGEVRPALMILLVAVGLVLIIACANVVNLLLSRALAQQKDLATRIVLGATSFDILAHCLAESILLVAGGVFLGLPLGVFAVRLIALSYPSAIPRLTGTTGLDWHIVLYAAFLAIVTALITGILPALRVSNITPLTALAGAGRSTETLSRSRLRSALLITETAVALVLLAGAGLLIKSFLHVYQINPGYGTNNLAVMSLTLPDASYPTFERHLQFVNSALTNISSVPGVRSVAAAGVLPLHSAPETDFELVGKRLNQGDEPSAHVFTATPAYFETLSIPLLGGRSFTAQDTMSSPTVVIINQTLAKRYYPGENPIGRTLIMKDWGDPLSAQIVGVVGDTRQDSLERDPKPAVYFSFAQFPQGTLVTYLVAKTVPRPELLMNDLRQRIWVLDKQMPVQVASMQVVLGQSLLRRKFILSLLASFAGLALLLAVSGIYSVVSYSVSQRTREFGIRVALGAQRYQVLGMVVRGGLKVVGIGIAVGLVAALIVTRVMGSLLYGVSASDPLTFGCIVAMLLLFTIAASLAPASRAMKIDPILALRSE